MDRSYRYLRILFGIRDKNGNSFHNLKKRGKKRWSNQISSLQNPKITNFKSKCYLLDLMLELRTECAPSFYSWVRVIKGALTPEVKTLAHWPTYEVIYRPTMTRLGPTYNQPIQCNRWWCNPDNNTCLANCPCYCFGRQPMKCYSPMMSY